MGAVRVALRVGNLLQGQRVPLLLVYLGVRVFAVLGELGDVDDPNGDLRSAEHFADNPHQALASAWSPVRQIFDWSCLVVAVSIRLVAPIFAPDDKKEQKHESDFISHMRFMIGRADQFFLKEILSKDESLLSMSR